MSWLLYVSENSSLENKLFTVIHESVPKSDFDICRSPQELAKRLHPAFLDVRVMVLCIESKQALEEILSCADLLTYRKNILILPDETMDTMAKAFTLSPSFITWVDCNFKDLGAVLKRMLDLYDVSPFADVQ